MKPNTQAIMHRLSPKDATDAVWELVKLGVTREEAEDALARMVRFIARSRSHGAAAIGIWIMLTAAHHLPTETRDASKRSARGESFMHTLHQLYQRVVPLLRHRWPQLGLKDPEGWISP